MKFKTTTLFSSPTFFLPFLLVSLLGSFSLIREACASGLPPSASTGIQVTAAEYCDFLNDVASSDVIPAQAGTQDTINSDHLFDEKMSTDPTVASIVRLGSPGRYHYEVIAGRENFPIAYVNEWNQLSFCDVENFLPDQDSFSSDLFLASNKSGFYAAVSASLNEQLSLSKTVSEICNHSGYYSLAAIGSIAFLGGVFSCCEEREEIPESVHKPLLGNGSNTGFDSKYSSLTSSDHLNQNGVNGVNESIVIDPPLVKLGEAKNVNSEEVTDTTNDVLSAKKLKDLNFEEVSEREYQPSLNQIDEAKTPERVTGVISGINKNLSPVREGNEYESETSPMKKKVEKTDPSHGEEIVSQRLAFDGEENLGTSEKKSEDDEKFASLVPGDRISDYIPSQSVRRGSGSQTEESVRSGSVRSKLSSNVLKKDIRGGIGRKIGKKSTNNTKVSTQYKGSEEGNDSQGRNQSEER